MHDVACAGTKAPEILLTNALIHSVPNMIHINYLIMVKKKVFQQFISVRNKGNITFL